MLLRLLDVLVCLSVCHALRDTLMVLHELFVGELVRLCTACSLTCCCVVCWTDQSLCTSLTCSVDQPERGYERASRVFYFGLWYRLPPKLFEQSSALLLFRCCGHSRAGCVPRGQWALLHTDMLVLIDP